MVELHIANVRTSDRYRLDAPCCPFSLKVEHCSYKADTAERYRQGVPEIYF